MQRTIILPLLLACASSLAHAGSKEVRGGLPTGQRMHKPMAVPSKPAGEGQKAEKPVTRMKTGRRIH